MSTAALREAATGTAVAKKGPHATLQGFFEKHKDQLAMALPKHLNADRMARLAMTAFSQNKALAECDPKSVFASVVVASQLGLEIGVTGQGYLVPYKGKCTFVPGWQGYVDLVSRSGRATVWTGAVFEGDEFDYALGDSPFVKHKPKGEDDPDKMIYVYAIGRVNGAQWPIIEVWPIRRVWKHRDKNNKVGRSHYSFTNQEMYARKVPLMQVLKYMPKSIELTNAMAVDLAASQGQSATIDGDFVTLDDGHVVDHETGEIQQSQQSAQQSQGSQQQPEQSGMSLYDECMAHVNKGNYDLAIDLGRELLPQNLERLKAEIEKKKGGAQ